MQKTLKSVDESSSENKIKVSVKKTTTSFFTTATKEATGTPRILIWKKKNKRRRIPKIPGHHLRQTTNHNQTNADHSQQKNKKTRARALNKLTNTSWGYRRQHLRQTYIALRRSIVEHARATLHPRLSKTNKEILVPTQGFACSHHSQPEHDTKRSSSPC